KITGRTMRKKLLAIGLLLIAFGCGNDSEDDVTPVVPGPVSLLTVTTGAPLDEFFSNDWIIVHDNDGSILAIESIASEGNFEIVVDQTIQGKVNVSRVEYRVDSNTGKNIFSAITYCGVDIGKHLILRSSKVRPMEPQKSFKVSVKDVFFIDHFTLSALHDAGGTASWASPPSILELKYSMQETDSRAIMTLFDGNDLRHRVLNDVKPNDSFSFSFEDMEPFDHTVEFTFPETDDIAFYVEAEEPGVETNSKYYLMSHYKYHPHSSITAGYLNSLANPTTSLTIGYPDFGYYFYHV